MSEEEKGFERWDGWALLVSLGSQEQVIRLWANGLNSLGFCISLITQAVCSIKTSSKVPLWCLPPGNVCMLGGWGGRVTTLTLEDGLCWELNVCVTQSTCSLNVNPCLFPLTFIAHDLEGDMEGRRARVTVWPVPVLEARRC